MDVVVVEHKEEEWVAATKVVGRWQEMNTALADIYLFPAKPTPANF